MKYRASVLAISAGLLAPMSGLHLALGQQVDIDRTDHETTIERSAETNRIERREQDNLAIEAISEAEIALIIRLLGPDDASTLSDDGKSVATDTETVAPAPNDGVPLRIHQLAEKIGAAYEGARYEEVFALLQSDPAVRAARPEVDIFEAWSAFKLGQFKQSLDLFESLYSADPSPSNAIGLLYSAIAAERFNHLSEFAITQSGPIADLVRPGQTAKTGSDLTKLDQVHTDFLKAWLGAAVKYQRTATIERVSTLLGIENPTSRDPGFLLSQAWQAKNNGNLDKALTLFKEIFALDTVSKEQMLNAQLGTALSLKETGGSDAVFTYLSGLDQRDQKLDQMYREELLSRGYDAYSAEKFSASLSLAEQADQPIGSNRKAQLLAAWSEFKLKRYDNAASRFEALYRTSPDKESADGVRASFAALNRLDDMNRLARDVDGPLLVSVTTGEETTKPEPLPDQIMSNTGADRAYYRGHLLSAALDDPATYGSVRQAGATWLGVGLRYQYRDGEQGLGEFEALSSKFSFYQTTGRHHMRAEFEIALLDSGGDPLDITLVGTRVLPEPGPRPFETTTDGTVVIPSFHWNREGEVEFDASIGATPVGGEVDPTVTGHFDVRFHADGAVYTLGAHRKSIYESILSLSGLQDPATGMSYGRVVETGVHAEVYQPLPGKWGLSGDVRVGERTGEQVADNINVFESVSVAYDLDLEGFSYFSIGPSYRYEAFDENLSRFTHGHGGYYSPSSLYNIGLGLNFLTEQGKKWIVKGSGSVAYETAEQDAAPYYPLDIQPGDLFYAATDSSGLGATAQVQGAWLLYDRVIAEAGAYALDASDYSEHGVFFKIRVTLGDRSELYQSDLTENLFRRYH